MANSLNLGWVRAIQGGTTAPLNIKMLWANENFPTNPIYYCNNQNTAGPYVWVPLTSASNITGKEYYATVIGANNYTGNCIVAPFLTATNFGTAGLLVKVKFNDANTGDVFVTIDGQGPYHVVKMGGLSLETGDILANEVLILVYDGAVFHAIGKMGSTSLPVGLTEGETLMWKDHGLPSQRWERTNTWNVDGVVGTAGYYFADAFNSASTSFSTTQLYSTITDLTTLAYNTEIQTAIDYRRELQDIVNNTIYSRKIDTTNGQNVAAAVFMTATGSYAIMAVNRLTPDNGFWDLTRVNNAILPYPTFASIGTNNANIALNLGAGSLLGGFVHLVIHEDSPLFELDVKHFGAGAINDILGFNSTLAVEGEHFSCGIVNDDTANNNSLPIGIAGSLYNFAAANTSKFRITDTQTLATFVNCSFLSSNLLGALPAWANIYSHCVFLGLGLSLPYRDATHTTFVHSLCKLGGEQKNVTFDNFTGSGTFNLDDNHEVYIIDGASLTAPLTFQLPTTPYNGQTYTIIGKGVFDINNVTITPDVLDAIYDTSSNTTLPNVIYNTSNSFAIMLSYSISDLTWYITVNSVGGGAPGPSTPSYNNTTQNSNYTVLPTDGVVLVDCSVTPITVTLPLAPTDKMLVMIKDYTGNANSKNITINGNGFNIDGAPTTLINVDFGSTSLYYNSLGGFWSII